MSCYHCDHDEIMHSDREYKIEVKIGQCLDDGCKCINYTDPYNVCEKCIQYPVRTWIIEPKPEVSSDEMRLCDDCCNEILEKTE